MGAEYERKFLTRGDAWRAHVREEMLIEQHYLARTDQLSFRVRITDDDFILTIKSTNAGVERFEWETRIPAADAKELVARSLSHVEKVRFVLDLAPGAWTVDQYGPAQHGLTMLEIETSGPADLTSIPEWVGREVTDDPTFRNEHLAKP